MESREVHRTRRRPREAVERCLACEADGERSDTARNGVVAYLRSTSVEVLDPHYRPVML
jgi:hypothetical protein